MFGAEEVGNRMTGGASLMSGGSQRLLAEQRSFSSVLSRATGTGVEQTPEKSAREGAEQFVSVALIQPILKQLRESSQAAEPFKPNSAERSFRAMYDAELAQRMVKGANWALVDRVARDVLRKESGARMDAGPIETGGPGRPGVPVASAP